MSESNTSFIDKFLVLKGSVRELWFVYVIKIFVIIAYSIMNSTIVLWLSSDLGFSDTNAGFIIATWSTGMTFTVMLVGSLSDALGVRKTFIIGFLICIASRLIMTILTVKVPVVIFGILPLAIGEAMLTPVLTASIRLFTNLKQRSMAFSMYYVIMNLGFAIGGWLFDFLRSKLGEYGHFVVPFIGSEISTYRTLFLISFLFSIPGLFVSYFLIRESIRVNDDGSIEKIESKTHYSGSWIQNLIQAITNTAKETKDIFISVWKVPTFYRFLLFLTLVVFVRMIFFHMNYTFPKFGIRELGDGAPIGQLWGVLNPVLIIILVPIIGAIFQKISAYKMVVVGSFVCAGGVFILALPFELFRPVVDTIFGTLIGRTWLGLKGEIHPYYISIVISTIFISIGEALWSPRLYEYTAEVAPKGQESSYMALSQLPFFLAKFLGGGFSGILLEQYCPKEGPRNSSVLWLIIAIITVISPIGLTLLGKFIQDEKS